MNIKEHTICAGDMSLAVKTWGEETNPAILALHGWQDNAATFDKLAPYFPDYYWVAPDFPGHGLSEHRGKGAEYSIWSYCAEIMALADAFELDTFTLMGHSMGGGVANLLSSLYPERVSKLILLDMIGTITTSSTASLAKMRTSIDQRNRKLRSPGLYSTRDAAIAARVKNGVSIESAKLLGARGIAESAQGFYWQHDQRLSQKNMLSMSEEQVLEFLKSVRCPVLLLTSKEAIHREETLHTRVSHVRDIKVESLAGGHHQHLDGDIQIIVDMIKEFMAKA